ncbi:Transposon Tf2-9 polyprotein, partial [Dictyocoela roeselum]
MNSILHELSGSTVFSTLDLNQGYYQIPVRKQDISKTGFRICGKTFAFKRMPFGLTNAPRTFTKAISSILENLNFVKIYMDDILIHSKTEEEHYKHVATVLQKLKIAGASINFEKSKFNVKEVRFLGHILTQDGVRADISNLDHFHIQTPKTKKKLQRVLGYLNWFRPFVKNYATLTSNLYKKLKKNNEKFSWTMEDSKELDKIISEIKKNQNLSHPNLNEDYMLEVDASKIGMGATLSQKGRIIGLYSATFKKNELNYTISEKECYAILKALNHFRQLVLGAKVTIRTDHSNNLFEKDLSQRQQRWKLLLQEFNFEMKNIKGEANIGADILSRNLNTVKLKTIKKGDEVAKKYKLKMLREYSELMKQIPTSFQKGGNKQDIVEKLKKAHEVLTHPGYKTMRNTLSEFGDIHQIKGIIKRICDTCEKCQREKENFVKTPKINILNHMPGPNEVIAVDIKGPVKYKHFKSNTKYKMFYLLVITEYLSRYTEIAIINDIHSTTICKAIDQNWFKVYGYSQACITDNGRQFNSLNFQQLLKQNKISHINTSPYNPSGNSVIERINKEIGIALILSRNSTLSECLLKIWRRINLS